MTESNDPSEMPPVDAVSNTEQEISDQIVDAAQSLNAASIEPAETQATEGAAMFPNDAVAKKSKKKKKKDKKESRRRTVAIIEPGTAVPETIEAKKEIVKKKLPAVPDATTVQAATSSHDDQIQPKVTGGEDIDLELEWEMNLLAGTDAQETEIERRNRELEEEVTRLKAELAAVKENTTSEPSRPKQTETNTQSVDAKHKHQNSGSRFWPVAEVKKLSMVTSVSSTASKFRVNGFGSSRFGALFGGSSQSPSPSDTSSSRATSENLDDDKLEMHFPVQGEMLERELDSDDEDLQAKKDVTATQNEVVDAIPDMIRSLKDYDVEDTIKLSTINSLRAMVVRGKLHGVEPKLLMLEAEAIPTLLGLLSNPELSEAASWTIQCLAAVPDAEDSCRKEIVACTGLVILMDMVISRSPTGVNQRHTIAALHNLAINSEFVRDLYARDSTFLEALLEYLNDKETRSTSAALVAQLTIKSEERKQLLTDVGAIIAVGDTLVGMVDADYPCRVSLAMCLKELVEGDQDRARVLLNRPLVVQRLELMIATEVSTNFGWSISKFSLGLSSASPDTLAGRFQEHIKAILSSVRRVEGNNAASPKPAVTINQTQITSNWTNQSAGNYPDDQGQFKTPAARSSMVSGAKEVTNVVWNKLGTKLGESVSQISKLTPASVGFGRPKLFGQTPRAHPDTNSMSDAKQEVNSSPEPVLNESDPEEKMLRRVTEQTLRREFQKAGGKCTPYQIAERFKSQLIDSTYGNENRARFRAVIDRIAEPVMIRVGDTLTQYLVLKDEQDRNPTNSSILGAPETYLQETNESDQELATSPDTEFAAPPVDCSTPSSKSSVDNDSHNEGAKCPIADDSGLEIDGAIAIDQH